MNADEPLADWELRLIGAKVCPDCQPGEDGSFTCDPSLPLCPYPALPTDPMHAVDLPNPNRTGPRVTGSCSCGTWSTTYGWGGHGDAAERAGDHVREAAKAHPLEMQTMDGTITVFEGVSL